MPNILRITHFAATPVLLLASLTLNIGLAFRERETERTLRTLQVLDLARSTVPVGTKVPALQGAWVDGRKTTVSFDTDTRDTIIYVFSPSCHWCARNLNNLKELERRTRDTYRFVGVSLSTAGLTDYMQAHGLTFSTVTSLPKELLIAYRLGATPETILISHDGVVKGVWRGAFRDTVAEGIEKQFHLALPGLLADAETTNK